MDKLIITVTVDSTMSYPRNPYCPPTEEVDKVAEEYINAVKAGASLVHLHGVHKLEDKIAEDGRKLSRTDYDGWRRLKEKIQEKVDPIIQFGIASARLEEKIRLMDLKPDMMSYCFTSHDEHFQPDPDYPANEIYALHPRDELVAFSRAALEKGVKVEVESFQTGAFYNMRYVAEHGLLPEPIWTTLFVDWPGGTWTPPTPKALINFVEHIPSEYKVNWNVSVMNPDTQWPVLTLAIIMGGHVRVGWEDNPFVRKGVYARTNAELVEKIVRIAHELGREVATPEEARKIVFGK